MIQRSSRASPGGSSALRTRWTRRSEFVTVPSLSAQDAAAGRTTSAISAVAVRKMSWTTMKSRVASRCFARVWSASDWTGFSPMHVERLELAALHRVEHPRQVPAALRRDGHAPGLVELRPERVVLDVLEARQPVGQGAHVAAALDVVLAAQRVEAAAVPADVAGQQRRG